MSKQIVLWPAHVGSIIQINGVWHKVVRTLEKGGNQIWTRRLTTTEVADLNRE